MDITQYLLVAIGSLTSAVVILWRISHVTMVSRLREKKEEIAELRGKIEVLEKETQKELERIIVSNMEVVKATTEVLKKILNEK